MPCYHHPLSTSNSVPIAIRAIGNPISQTSPESLLVRSTLGTSCPRGQVVQCGHEARRGGLFLQEGGRSASRVGHYHGEAGTGYIKGPGGAFVRMRGSDVA